MNTFQALRAAAAAALAGLLAAAAQAHPGHGLSSPAELLHHLADPANWPLALALGAAGVAAIATVLRSAARGRHDD